MRKPTKLGFCTCCNTKVYVFDSDGHPVKIRSNYREAMLLLSDGSRGRAAFCVNCLHDGVDAEEAIANLVDGLEADMEKKAWTDEFKQWYIARYRPLKIMEAEAFFKPGNQGEPVPIEAKEHAKVKPFSKLFVGEFEAIPVTKPPERLPSERPS